MKIAIYGVSRAGKDYFIGKAREQVPELYHLRGSETLKKLSEELLGKAFAQTDEDEKNVLRETFVKRAQEAEGEHGCMVVDGHYAFPADGGYRIAFTEADRNLYDVFLYLKPKTERIIENQKRLKDGKPVKQLTAEEIEAWEEYEIAQMQEVCSGLDKELIVLDGDIPVCVEFLKQIIATPAICQPREAVREMLKGYADEIAKSSVVVVTDCDKTVAVNDTGDLFGRFVGLDGKIVKEIFKGDYYSAYQFFKWKKLYARAMQEGTFTDGCAYAVRAAEINEKLKNDVLNGSALTIGITTGVIEIWGEIRRNISYPRLLFGNSMSETLIVSATTKRMLVEELRKMGKYVIALGDGTLDMPMLNAADKGFIVAESKLSKSVAVYFATHKTRIRQLGYSKFKYDGVEVARSIWD